ncbi:hypothetical protein EBT31_02675 [bacterium]|nr:hypothetical protein [bacterium]NBX48638.1 hypothetical protein [bacterium]
MIANAETCIKALRALAQDIQSEDGVANAALHECADRMEQLENDIKRLTTANLQLREGVEELKKRIQRWHDTLTPLMPSDLKSWHENNPSELPEVTAWVIESQRQRIAEIEAENDALRADLLLWENGGPLP